MKTPAIVMASSIWVAMVAGQLLVSGAAAPSAGEPDIAKLRKDAKAAFGPLPERMPGSEADTAERIALGKKLFFDVRLSKNESQSCNTCHRVDAQLGGVDNEATSGGAFGKRGDRNAPTVLNAGYHFAQFWDGRAAGLKDQAKGPVLNPVEMAMPSEGEVVKRLEADPEYPKMFAAAFPGPGPAISYDHMAEAIAAFERTLRTQDRFDDFQNGDDKALTVAELKGLRLFLDAGCTTCHSQPTLGAQSYQKVGLIHPYENTQDTGRAQVTKDEDDQFKFKVPSLRNVAITGPYFHDGAQAELAVVVRKMGHMQLDKTLEDAEVEAIVAFLNSLTDKGRNPKAKS